MFFVLSKFLYFLIQPINWLGVCLVLSFFSKKRLWKRRFLGFGIFIFWFFTNHFIFNQVMNWWEPEAIAHQKLEVFEVGILAGGYSNFFINSQNGLYHFNGRAARLTQTAELFFQKKIKTILLTGGSGYLFGQEPSEAAEAKQLLLTLGIPDSCILIENASRNTYENAFNSKVFLDKNFEKQASCLLITSAYHMPRTAACFRKQGIAFSPFCVDYIGEKTRFVPESILIPDRLGFYRWERLIKEWVGYGVYWLRGYL